MGLDMVNFINFGKFKLQTRIIIIINIHLGTHKIKDNRISEFFFLNGNHRIRDASKKIQL